jgi:hypothetical protein
MRADQKGFTKLRSSKYTGTSPPKDGDDMNFFIDFCIKGSIKISFGCAIWDWDFDDTPSIFCDLGDTDMFVYRVREV